MKFSLYILIFLLTMSLSILAQNEFPRDTSYTVNSTFKKLVKKYPEITPVKYFSSDLFLSLPNQVYRIRDNRTLRMDVFIPNHLKSGKRPLVMMIHGGGWASGDKSHLVPLAQKLAMDGYVTACVEQRLSPEAKYPAAVYDLKEALKFLKHNCDVYGVDTTQIAVLGASSGATMASLMATTCDMAKFEDPDSKYKNISTSVQVLINIDGVVDFTDPNESAKDQDPNKPSAGARFFGSTYKESPELWREASAINYVNNCSPVTLYVNSSIPRFHAGREEFISILNKKDIYNEIHTVDNTPHAFWLFHPWFDETYSYVSQFLDKVFIVK